MTCLRERRSVQLGCERVGGASEAGRTHARENRLGISGVCEAAGREAVL